MSTVVSFETIADMFLNLSDLYAGQNKTVFARKPASTAPYEPIDWDRFSDDVFTLASYYTGQGIKKGDRVAILSENRYEWAVFDMAAQLIGAVNVALYTSLPPAQCEYILKDSGALLFFVSTGIQLKKAVQIFDNCPELQLVIAFDKPRKSELLKKPFVILFNQVLATGKKNLARFRASILEQAHAITPDDLSTLIYTSGTTGNPKGAMLTNRNIVSNVIACHEMIEIRKDDRTLSFLPLCHSFERTGGYYAILAGGGEIYFAESVDTVSKNMVEARPTIVMSVPRLFEKIYNLIKISINEGPDIKRKIFDWALTVGHKYVNGRRGFISIQKKLADQLVFDKLKQRTGGRIRFFVSGGAALPPEIGKFFMSAGLRILEGYGLTETSPVISVNRYKEERIGTVGHVIPGITVGIQRLDDSRIIAEISGEDYPVEMTSDAGEILCRGSNVMKGYWNQPEATREVIDPDGWFHTGDIGRFVEGRLQITDRLKHMIVNAGGKNIYPGPIEDLFKTSIYIDQFVVVGEKQNYMAALIVPDFDQLKSYAVEHDIQYKDIEDLLDREAIRDLLGKEIRSFTKYLASHEKIRKFRLLANEFTVETGELTPTLKVKRRVIEEKYRDLIEDMFRENGK